MCGLAGFFGKGSFKDIKKMADRISHRGPDAEGYWHDSEMGVYLAHKRLSIIDIEGGSQPMWTDDKTVGVVFNGEIYNHLELRDELVKRGYRFQTDHSDTEVLLWAYKEWGETFCERLNGMWAFAIYDKANKKIFISRDRFGQKPLFYSFQNGTFAFSSELTSLLEHSSIEASVSTNCLKKYFAYGFIPAPLSPFTRVYKLPAGFNLSLNLQSSDLKIYKYWDFVVEPFDTIPKNPEKVWGEKIRELLSLAVKRRLISDVPLGIFLSGGIDSSSIAAFATELSGANAVKTFSIGFTEQSFNESNFAQSMADHIGTFHHSKLFSNSKLASILTEVTDKLDEPFGDSSLLPTYLLCQEAKKYVTVALSGDGADELFAGYDPFHAINLANIYKKLVPEPIHIALRLILNRLPVSHRNMSIDFKIKRTLQGLSYPKEMWNPIWLGPLEAKDIEELFKESIDLEDLYSEAIECWESCHNGTMIDKTIQFYTKLYLQNSILTKIDRAGMLNALEVRSPFLDIDFVDFVRKIPGCFKYRKGCTKYILKKAIAGVLPDDIIYRQKHGFGFPVGKWFKNGTLKCDENQFLTIFNKSFIHKQYTEHVKVRSDNRLFLWSYWLLGSFLNDLKN
ncbi:MAG: asparagine synthase (glutamine-hydrolyzing) [Deltaproteobacteria bacterium]|nr:asparagine synthase (glutamine-hydrolyzing) [Deltaproteobacteria bacterium]